MSKVLSIAPESQLHHALEGSELRLEKNGVVDQLVAWVHPQKRTAQPDRRDPLVGDRTIFKNILHANDGSGAAFHALSLALTIAWQTKSQLHVVCVNELPYLAEFMDEVDQTMEAGAQRIEGVVMRANAMAKARDIALETHVIAGDPVRI